jgi:tetratricopeptide (TPR) repeat protein
VRAGEVPLVLLTRRAEVSAQAGRGRLLPGAGPPEVVSQRRTLLVLCWDPAGSQLADVPPWHLHRTAVGLGILIGLLAGAALAFLLFLWSLIAPLKPDFGEFLIAPIGLGIPAAFLPLLLNMVGLLSAGVAWRCGLATVAGIASSVSVIALARWCWGTSVRRRAAVTVLAAGLLLLLFAGFASGLMLLMTRVPQPAFQVDDCHLQAAAFGPDASTLALAVEKGDNPRIEVRAVESGSLIRTETGVRDVTRIAVDTTGVCLVATYNTVRRLSGQGPGKDDRADWLEGPPPVAFLGDGKTLALPEREHIRLVDLLTGTEQRLPVRRSVRNRPLVTSLQGTVLASSGSSAAREADRSWSDQVLLWALPEKTPRVIPLRGEDVERLALSHDGKRLAVTSTTLRKNNDRAPLTTWLRVFDVPSGKEIARQEVKHVWGGDLTFSPSGDVLVRGFEELLVWNLKTGQRSKIAHDGRVFQGGLRFSPDGRRLVAVKQPGNLKQAIEEGLKGVVRQMNIEAARGLPQEIQDRLIEPAEARKRPETQVLTWTYPGLKPGKPVPTPCEGEVLSPDGRLLGGTFLQGRWLLIHQWETGETVFRPLPIPTAGACAFAPDGRHVAVPLADGTVIVLRLWDTDGRERLLAACNAVLARDPRSVPALVQRGGLHLEQGRHAQALADARAALAVQPGNRQALHLSGLAHAAGKEHNQALAVFAELIRLDPNDAVAWLQRGLAHADRGDIVSARADVERALKLNPKLADRPRFQVPAAR